MSTSKFILAALLFANFVAASHAAPKELFNGRDLAGWVKMHGGEWKVENGVIVGSKGVEWTTNPEKSGSWLRTEKEYGDFVLELEFAINEKGNAGVFVDHLAHTFEIRSSEFELARRRRDACTVLERRLARNTHGLSPHPASHVRLAIGSWPSPAVRASIVEPRLP